MGWFGKGKERREKVLSGGGGHAAGWEMAAARQAVTIARSGPTAQQLLSTGVPGTYGRVESVVDTGAQVHHDPVVDLLLSVDGHDRPIGLRTIVPRISVPRPGEGVVLVDDPENPGTYLYAGLSL
ncbi:hypothetical protein V5P93_003198 [Actinokineospora auranticolor]|uniref:Uncharacterized protein n=1 Tax=Actinokineospora auranticolor TaxID=155976 RepID=A0A2S6H1I6_9PSEU|nr:hypothetical protein [Actinokineospora auranticolor]PPK71332.1 hypothetical protein CLV40_101521 [Actinokineospora auranticolor]